MHMQMKFISSLSFVSLLSLLLTACEKREASHDDIVKADLLLIIDSLGSPCEQVLEYEATDELAYTVSCESGDTYRVSVNPQGRVDIQNNE
jgi:hypothetical protein